MGREKGRDSLARAGRVDDAIALTQTIDDASAREYAVREVASVLAQTGQVDNAITVWTTAAPGDNNHFLAVEMAKTAAEASDVDGALQLAGVIDNEYSRCRSRRSCGERRRPRREHSAGNGDRSRHRT